MIFIRMQLDYYTIRLYALRYALYNIDSFFNRVPGFLSYWYNITDIKTCDLTPSFSEW